MCLLWFSLCHRHYQEDKVEDGWRKGRSWQGRSWVGMFMGVWGNWILHQCLQSCCSMAIAGVCPATS